MGGGGLRGLAVGLLSAAHLLLVAVQVPGHGPAMDEPIHLFAGHTMWRTGGSFDPTHPPLARYFLTLPLLFLNPEPGPGLGQPGHPPHDQLNHFIVHSSVGPQLMLGSTRGMAALLSLAAVLLGWRWSRRLWGEGGGLFTLALLAFCPLLLAESPIVGNDVACALTVLLALASFGRYLQRPDRRSLALFALCFCAAQASKFSAVLLVPICAALYLGKRWLERRGHSPPGAPPAPVALRDAGLVAAASFLLMWGLYQFEVLSVLQDPQITGHVRAEEIKQRLTRLPGWLVDLPIPLYSYWKGLVVQTFHAGNQATWTEGINHQFLYGHNSLNGWRHYFPAAMAVKTPLALLALAAAAAVLLVRRWRQPSQAAGQDQPAAGQPPGQAFGPALEQGPGDDRFGVLLLLLPAALWLLFCALLTINIGIRYVLPVYLLLAIGLGALWPLAVRAGRHRLRWHALLILLAGWQAADSVRVAPHLHGYFNQLAGGPAGGWRYLNNSSLDWGQDLPALSHFLRQQGITRYYLDYFGAALPDDWGVTGHQPLPLTEEELGRVRGVVVVSQTNLTAQGRREPLYRRLRALTPLAQVGWTLFVYRL